MIPFIGREPELTALRNLQNNAATNLVIVRGRRRIGKSRLIDEFAKPYKYFKFEGLMPRKGISANDQREEFARQLQHYFDFPSLKADDWGDLLTALAKQVQKGRVIILFDELSWMALGDPDFLGKLKIAWDNYFIKNPKLTVFLCSSISPWIEKNLVGSSGYLGRPTLDLTLQELPLKISSEFLNKSIGEISAYEKFKILSITGGIPRYLELMNKNMSAEENIKNLFFNVSSPLMEEFNHIFTDIYTKRNTIYRRIIRELVDTKLSQQDISVKTNIKQTGDLTEYLSDLELGGFISRDFTWNISTNKISKLSHYRLKDNYTRFYLKYIEPNEEKIKKGLFDQRALSSLPGLDTIFGLQFENLVISNHKTIIKLLNIRPEEIIFANPYFQRKTTRSAACQIDYLIQTKDSAYIIEIKFRRNAIGKSIINEVNEKLKKVKVPKHMSKRAVLIHVNGVTNEVEESIFFSRIIDFSELISHE